MEAAVNFIPFVGLQLLLLIASVIMRRKALALAASRQKSLSIVTLWAVLACLFAAMTQIEAFVMFGFVGAVLVFVVALWFAYTCPRALRLTDRRADGSEKGF